MQVARDYSRIHGEKCWEPIASLSPCEMNCPAGINIPGFIMALAKGRFDDALKIIIDAMPLPGTLGRICHHPCELECNRAVIDDPIDIMRLKRFAFDYGQNDEIDALNQKPGAEKVAVIGSGPAGLTAADFLNRLGHPVTVFEAGPTPGGMLVRAIPEFILPRQVIEAEIDCLLQKGVKIRTGTALGNHISLEELGYKGFKAILVATGTPKSLMLDLPGSELSGIVSALSLLKGSRLGEQKKVHGNVVVIGGGNVAMDAARVARRLGAAKVDLVCLEACGQMLAFDPELDACGREGIVVHNALAPQRFVPNGTRNKIGAIEFQRVSCLNQDPECGLTWDLDDGPGCNVRLETDLAVVAIGQLVDVDFLEEAKLKKDKRGRIVTEKDSLMTSHPGIFMAGDVLSGRGNAVDAIAAGKKAAGCIDAYIRQSRHVNALFSEKEGAAFKLEKKMVPSFFTQQRRWAPVSVELSNRIRSFEEIDLGLTVTGAGEEARRCLNCKQCGTCMFERGQICFDQASRILW